MRILITGATGFLGRVLLPMAIEKIPDATFMCCVRSETDAKAFKNVPKILCSVGVDMALIQQFNPEVVIHLAAYNTAQESLSDIDALVESNIHYGLQLLYALRTTSLRLFINTGSFSQYSQSGDAYLYSASKSAFEIFLKYYSREYQWKYINVVPYSIYGGEKTIKRILDYIIESIDAATPVDMSPGEQYLDFIHVYDVASFYISVLENIESMTLGDIFHIGTGKATSIRELATVVEEVSGRKCNINWGGRAYRSNDIMYACAPRQEKRDLIWQPQFSLMSGIREYMKEDCS